MANNPYQFTQTGAEIQALLNKVQSPDSSPTANSTNLVTSGGVKAALDGKVNTVPGKGLSTNDYTDAEKAKLGELPTNADLQTTLAGKAAKSDVDAIEGKIPSSASSSNKMATQADLTDFITRAVADLVNYYTKSETYTQTEVNNLIGALHQFHFEIYATLPATGDGSVLYLIGPTGTGSDKYEEYVWANDTWTKIGDTTIDLSGYVTTEALNAALANYTTTAQLTELLGRKANTSDLKDGTVVPKLAGDLESWASRANLSVLSRFADAVRTTAGDDSIVSSAGAKLMSVVPKTDFYASALRFTGRNLLRDAVAVGDGWYFLVPALPFGTFGTATKPNGLLFTNSAGENLTPTVRFKALSAGVPTSVADGDACAYTDSNGYRFYNPTEVGYIIVSGITRSATCAKVAWSYGYDDYIAIDAASDAGGSIALSTAIHALHSYDLMLVAGGVADRIDYNSDTKLRWVRNCDRVKPTWTNVDNGDGTYTHFATISTMRSGGEVECGNLNMAVNDQTISYTDENASATGDWVKFELATPATGTVNVSPLASVDDMGLEVMQGISGSAIVLLAYAQGYPDSVAALVAGVLDEITAAVAQVVTSVENRVAALEDQIRDGFGTLVVENLEVRKSLNNFTTEGNTNASGAGAPNFIPVKIGQAYFDTTNKVWYEATAFSVEGWKLRTNS